MSRNKREGYYCGRSAKSFSGVRVHYRKPYKGMSLKWTYHTDDEGKTYFLVRT